MQFFFTSIYRRNTLLAVFFCAVALYGFLITRPPALLEEPDPPTSLRTFHQEQFKQKQYKSAMLPPLAATPVYLPPLVYGTPGLFRVVALPEWFEARALNNKGEVAGTWDGDQGALWANGKLRVFPRDSGAKENVRCDAVCLNDASVVGGIIIESGSGAAGYAEMRDVVFWNRAFKPAARRVIGKLPNLSFAALYGLNNRNQAVGACSPGYSLEIRDNFSPDESVSFEKTNAFCWDGRQMLDLGRGLACGINERGQVVGSQDRKIVLWEGSEKRVLGDGTGYAINNRGQILADFQKYANEPDEAPEPLSVPLPGAVVLDRGKSIGIGLLPGDSGGAAKSLNDRGEVVGKSESDPSSPVSKSRAFLWRAGKNYDLNHFISPRSGWVLHDARSINNKGWIVGEGTLRGQPRSFLLIPK